MLHMCTETFTISPNGPPNLSNFLFKKQTFDLRNVGSGLTCLSILSITALFHAVSNPLKVPVLTNNFRAAFQNRSANLGGLFYGNWMEREN